MRDVLEIIRQQRSCRVASEAEQQIPDEDVQQSGYAACRAPTARNRQAFEVVIADDKATLTTIGTIRSQPSDTFLRENYRQLAFSKEELLRRKTGVLASMFPPSWRKPNPGRKQAPSRNTPASATRCRIARSWRSSSTIRASARRIPKETFRV